jgi:hypothetical protein
MPVSDAVYMQTSMTTADELKRQIMARRKGGPIPDLSFLAADGVKKCRLCLQVLPIANYCKMARTLDGLETRCRECNKARVRAIRDKTPGYNTKHSRNFKERHPEKRAAHLAVARALRAGTLTKQPCLICGNIKAESHHDDYTKPLDVIWLCRQHHAAHHEAQRKQSEQNS